MPTIKCLSLANQASEQYWTKERMANVIMESPIYPESVDSVPMSGNIIQKGTTNFSLPSGYPDTMPEQNKDTPVITESLIDPGVPIAAPNPPEYNLPFWNCGMWYYTNIDDGLQYGCTAAFVGSKNVLTTAAHCVISLKTGRWHSNFKFVRAYHNGGNPQVVYPSEICIYEETFTNRFNPEYDYAFMSTYQASGAGWLGFDTDISYRVVSIGYPTCFGGNPIIPNCAAGGGTVPTSVGNMYYDQGEITSASNGIATMIDNPMQRGISGGPMIKNFNTGTSSGGNNLAVGLNSFGSKIKNSVSSPVFTEDTYNLLIHSINQNK